MTYSRGFLFPILKNFGIYIRIKLFTARWRKVFQANIYFYLVYHYSIYSVFTTAAVDGICLKCTPHYELLNKSIISVLKLRLSHAYDFQRLTEFFILSWNLHIIHIIINHINFFQYVTLWVNIQVEKQTKFILTCCVLIDYNLSISSALYGSLQNKHIYFVNTDYL